MQLSISPRARADMDEIWAFIASESSIEIADRVLDSLAKKFHLLRLAPYAGRSRTHDLRAGLRSIASGKYVVFYTVNAGIVRIVRVLHGSRDLPAYL